MDVTQWGSELLKHICLLCERGNLDIPGALKYFKCSTGCFRHLFGWKGEDPAGGTKETMPFVQALEVIAGHLIPPSVTWTGWLNRKVWLDFQVE